MTEENSPKVIHWNNRLEKYFCSTGEKAHCMSWLHKRSEALYSLATTFIDLPVIIISGIVGAVSIGTNGLFGPDTSASVILGGLSIFVGILNTIGAYFAWGKRSELHRVASIQYSKMYRQLNVEMSLPRKERTPPDELLKYVRNEYERLSEISPLIPRIVIKKFNSLFDGNKDKDEISRPEEVNGLEKIDIFNEKELQEMAKTEDPVPEEEKPAENLDTIIGVQEGEPVKDEETAVPSPVTVTVSPLPNLEEIVKNTGNKVKGVTWK